MFECVCLALSAYMSIFSMWCSKLNHFSLVQTKRTKKAGIVGKYGRCQLIIQILLLSRFIIIIFCLLWGVINGGWK